MKQKKINSLAVLREKIDIILEATKANESLALITHNDPDGDGLAACLGLKRLFASLNIPLDIVLQGDSLDKLDYLKVADNVIGLYQEMQYDNLIIIDCHGYDRIGDAKLLVPKAKRVLIIDHHIITSVIDCGDYYIDPEAASVGIIIYNALKDLLQNCDAKTSNYFATAIYTTIINDTNNFLNTNVDEEVFKISAELLEYGINPADITLKFLYQKSPQEFKMVGQSLSTIELYHENKTLLFHTTREFLDSNKLDDSATSKMTQWVKGVKEVEVVLYYWQKSKDEYKFSIRSEIHNVQQIANIFGGGGHDKASGFTAVGDIKEITDKVLAEINAKIYG